MNSLLLHEIFTEWNKTQGLVKLGIGDYFLLLKLISEKAASVQTFEDFVFTCETLWVKTWEQQSAFQQLFEKRRQGILEFIEWLNKKRESPQPLRDVIVHRNPVVDIIAPEGDAVTAGGDNSAEKKPSVTGPPPPPDKKEPEGLVIINLGGDTAHTNKDAEAKGYYFTTQTEVLSASHRYLFGTEYFPVSSRVLQQNWRSLYSNQETEKLGEINLPETIKKISREGNFFDFVYQPAEINRLSLFIFIDQGGSMAALEAFGKGLVTTALESQVHANVQPYFFYNIPEPHPQDDSAFILYNEHRTESFITTKLFKGLNKNNIALLIYSDAGAINGNINSERLNYTEIFLKSILKCTGFIAWLNPAPEHRWNDTTAGAIRLRVPEVGMFEAEGSGITQAVNALKGKLTPTLKKQYVAATGQYHQTHNR